MEHAGQRRATRVQRRQGKTGQVVPQYSVTGAVLGLCERHWPQLVGVSLRSQHEAWSMEGISWASLAAACGLELAENVRLNNFLPTALSDVHAHALQMGEPLDTVLICSRMASSLSYALP